MRDHHDAEDECFLVVPGRLDIELRDGRMELEEGEFVVIPRGVEHKPVDVGGEAYVPLLERRAPSARGTSATRERSGIWDGS